MMKRLKMIALSGLFGMMTWAQTPNYSSLMSQAKSYFDQKEYAKAIDCYEKVCVELNGSEYESLIPSVRTSIAINNMYLGVAALKAKDFISSKTYLENAIKDARPESKAYYMVQSWMGQWYSVQALNIRSNRGDLQQAVLFSLEAERHFDLAQAPEKRIKEQLSRAAALQELSRNEEAEALLTLIIKECEGFSDRSLIMGKAAYRLGEIELASERFQSSLSHLEQSYDLCISEATKDAKTWAYLAANKLSNVYTTSIPDNDKALLWKQRADELEPQTQQ